MSIDDELDYCGQEGSQLTEYLCVWYDVMQHNLKGQGTTFNHDPKHYNQKQVECLRCYGLKTECKRYFNE